MLLPVSEYTGWVPGEARTRALDVLPEPAVRDAAAGVSKRAAAIHATTEVAA
jgi:hypothetical protein